MNDPRIVPARTPNGFTVVEVVVALIILTVGVLGMAGTTALVVRQVTASRMATERALALQTAIERARAIDYEGLEGASSDTLGLFTVRWSVTDVGKSKLIRFITEGPGMSRLPGSLGMVSSAVADTFTYRMIKP